MGITDKIKNEAEHLVGKGKQMLGKATDDEQMQGEGVADQAEATVKKAGERVKDTANDVKDTAKEAKGD